MGFFRRTSVTEAEPGTTVSLSDHAAVVNQNEMLAEALGDGLAALRREDIGWRKVGGDQTPTFTRAELLTIHNVCLMAFIKSPLIGRGVRIRRNFVWGGGVEIAARDTSEEGNSPVNELIQDLLDSPEFKRTLGSAQAREEREVNLHCAGEFFLLAVHVEDRVRPRLVPAAQIVDYISHPEDSSEVWFYKREWVTNRVELITGRREAIRNVEWHPALDYRPEAGRRLPTIGGVVVRWDAPIQHCAVNSVTDAPWGVPVTYAALDWDKAYADYLGRWAGLMTALSRYAFKATAPAKHKGTVTKALQNGRGTDPITGTPTDPAGATVVMSPDATMAPMHSSGATIDAGSGKPLAGMVAAALDVPITMLLADPGITGARATAETLDKPLEDSTGASQELWTDWLKAFFAHVVTVAIEDQLLPADVDATVDVTFPPLSDMPLTERLSALQTALDAGAPLPLILRLMLEALGVEDVDEVLQEMQDADGNFVDPRITAQLAALQRERNGAPGSQAAEAYQAPTDPRSELLSAVAERLAEPPAAPVVHVNVPEGRRTTRRVERDADGNITAIVEE